MKTTTENKQKLTEEELDNVQGGWSNSNWNNVSDYIDALGDR